MLDEKVRSRKGVRYTRARRPGRLEIHLPVYLKAAIWSLEKAWRQFLEVMIKRGQQDIG